MWKKKRMTDFIGDKMINKNTEEEDFLNLIMGRDTDELGRAIRLLETMEHRVDSLGTAMIDLQKLYTALALRVDALERR